MIHSTESTALDIEKHLTELREINKILARQQDRFTVLMFVMPHILDLTLPYRPGEERLQEFVVALRVNIQNFPELFRTLDELREYLEGIERLPGDPP